MKTRTHWTSSALKEYDTCPAKYRWSYLFEPADWRKLGYALAPKKDSPAMDRGTEIHATCEQYLLGQVSINGLHPEIRPQWRNLIKGLRDAGAIAEQQWEFDSEWYTHSGEHPLWLRMKIDAHLLPKPTVARVIDYKTGKMYLSNREQMEVYALGAFAKFDEIDLVETELWYFDQGEVDARSFTRKEVSKLARRWEGRAARMLNAETYPEQKNKFCDWCPFSKTKGGPCKTA